MYVLYACVENIRLARRAGEIKADGRVESHYQMLATACRAAVHTVNTYDFAPDDLANKFLWNYHHYYYYYYWLTRNIIFEELLLGRMLLLGI